MKAELKDKRLVITIPLEPKPRISGTGKSYIVAHTGGFAMTDVLIDDKFVAISVNAMIRAD